MSWRITAVALIAALAFTAGMVNTSYARDGGGDRTVEMLQKTNKDLKTLTKPRQLHSKVVVTGGTVIGTAIGEPLCTFVSCIGRLFGSDSGYRFGDMTRQSADALEVVWTGKRSKPELRPRGYGLRQHSTGIGTHMGYQAIDR